MKSEDSAAKTGFSSRALGPQCATNHCTRWALHSDKPMSRHFVVRPLNEFRYVAFASYPHSSSAAGEPLFCGKTSLKHTHESSSELASPINQSAQPTRRHVPIWRCVAIARTELRPCLGLMSHMCMSPRMKHGKHENARLQGNIQAGNQLTVFGNKKGTPQGPLGISNGVGGGTGTRKTVKVTSTSS